jgi:hypothetical protein
MLARKPRPLKPVPPNQKVHEMHRKSLNDLLSLTLLSLALLPPSFACAMPTTTSPDAVFTPILPKLKATKVAVLLPADTNRKGELGMPDSDHARIEDISSSRYVISLEVGPDCQGASSCHIGTIVGEKLTPKSPKRKGKKIKLATGQTAYFVDATCGANCNDSKLSWEQGGFRYTVAMKAEKPEILTKIANSFQPLK